MLRLFSSLQVIGMAIAMSSITSAQETAGIPYRVEGSGPLLIYIAGLEGAGELFYKQAPALARSYRVVMFRLRESGRFTYDDLTGDVATIIKETGESRATVVGESFDG